MNDKVAIGHTEEGKYIVAYTSEWKAILDQDKHIKDIIEITADLNQLWKMKLEQVQEWAKEQFEGLIWLDLEEQVWYLNKTLTVN